MKNDSKISVRIPEPIRKECERLKINVSEVCRDAIMKAIVTQSLKKKAS